jgi:protein gp37
VVYEPFYFEWFMPRQDQLLIDVLQKVPCKVRLVSFEPLIGPVGKLDLSGISWRDEFGMSIQ